MSKQNLSEQLFADVVTYPETSTLIRRVSKTYCSPNTAKTHWYRLLTKATWLWRGLSYSDITEPLARIASSTHPRSNEHLLDTVVGYRSGNWIYEWSQQALYWQKQALVTTEENAAQYWLKAANLFSIACYPHLHGDTLAEQAEILMNKAYEQAFKYCCYPRKSLTFTVDGRPLIATLHLPNVGKPPYPTILLCANLTNLQGDYYQLFQRYLAPAGYAMLCVDMPSIGYSAHYKLSTDSSKLHQQVLHQLPNIAWIDHHNVFALGFLFGANAAVRLGYLEPKRLRGVISWNGLVHHLMADQNAYCTISDMHRDVLVSRIGLSSISDSLLEAELSRYSLKVQGLLGRRCKTPMLAICLHDSIYQAAADAKLIASSSQEGKLVAINHQNQMCDHITLSIQEMLAWLANRRTE